MVNRGFLEIYYQIYDIFSEGESGLCDDAVEVLGTIYSRIIDIYGAEWYKMSDQAQQTVIKSLLKTAIYQEKADWLSDGF